MLDITLVRDSRFDRPSSTRQLLVSVQDWHGEMAADLFWYGLRPSIGKIGPISFPLLPAGLPAADPVRLGACWAFPAAAGAGAGAAAAAETLACSRLTGLPIFSPSHWTTSNPRTMMSLYGSATGTSQCTSKAS